MIAKTGAGHYNTAPMRKVLAVAALLAGCMEPPKTLQMEQAVDGLSDLYAWDPATKARGQYSYDAIIMRLPEILPALVSHLTNPKLTKIDLQSFKIKVSIGDICLLMLLEALKMKWQDFEEEGLWMSTQIPNPVFCIRFKDDESRRKVQARFAGILKERGLAP